MAETKQTLTIRFADVQGDDDLADKVEAVAGWIREGFTSGYYPAWALVYDTDNNNQENS